MCTSTPYAMFTKPSQFTNWQKIGKSTKRNEETKATTLKHSLCVFSSLLSYKTLFLINISSLFILYFYFCWTCVENKDGLCRNVFLLLADYANFVIYFLLHAVFLNCMYSIDTKTQSLNGLLSIFFKTHAA